MSDAAHRRIDANGGHGLTYGIPKTDEWKKRISEAHKKIRDIHAETIKKYGEEHPEMWEKAIATKRLKYGDRMASKPAINARQIQCIDSGCVYESIAAFARSMNLSLYYAHKYPNTGESLNGLHYKYIDKGEIKDGNRTEEGQTNPSEG